MKKLILLLVFLLSWTGVCGALTKLPFHWPTPGHLEGWKNADFKAIEHSIYTDSWTANFSIEFNTAPIFDGNTHGFEFSLFEVDSAYDVGSVYRSSIVNGWSQSASQTINGISHVTYDRDAHEVYGNGYGPEIGPVYYTLIDKTIDFAIPLSMLNIDENFGYWLDVRDFTRNDTSLTVGYTNNTYNAAVPEPATMFLFGVGLVGLAGFKRKFKK